MSDPRDAPDDVDWAAYYRWSGDRPVRELPDCARAAYAGPQH